MEKLFLLDAYALIYRAYYALMKNPRINSKGLNTSAILGFVNTLEDVLKNQKPTHIGVAFDPSGPTFRHEMYSPYKAQREETPEAIRYSVPIIKDIIRAYNIPILEVKGYEADDVIGTIATKAGKAGIETYMMTPDKDYGQLITENVYMFRPSKGGISDFEIIDVNKVNEKYNLSSPTQVIDYLGLMGDASDNIPGCPGVGDVTAKKLIAQFGSIENMLEHTDDLKGALKKKVEENVEQIKLSKFLATIKTDVPIELNMDELKLEEPNEEKLYEIFEDLEFRTLLTRVLKKKAPTPKKTQVMPDLFGFSTDENTEIVENSNLKTYSEDEFEYKLIDTEEKRKELYDYLFTFNLLSLDTETTSTEAMNADLVGLSFSVKENEAFYVPIPENRTEALKIVNEFKTLYENEKILKIGQNIKYDIIVLANYGIHVQGEMFDTMVAHYVIQPELQHNMDYLAEVYLGYKTIHIDELIGAKGKKQKNMRDLDPKDVYVYACEDADVTLKLKNILQEKLKESHAEKLFYEIEMPLVPVLAYMERNGARIETKSLKETSIFFSERVREIESNIYELAGQEFNIASPKQVGEILFDKLHISEKAKKTKTGQYVTSEEILQSLKSKHPIVGKILEHRGLKKLLGTYVDALPELINPKTGKIHTSYNQTITSTGRLSSSNPNLQNIPIRDDDGKLMRKAFIPEEGCEFFSADYSQIELRIMAHLSEDPNLIEAFNSGFDIHAATAAKIFKKKLEDVTREERSKAKTANFGIIYGISVFGLAERMNVARKEAKELIDEYFNTYPGVKAYMEKSIKVAQEKGYIETIFNRKRYLPDINSHNANVRGYAERNAINAPIQGSAADIIKVAMINIYKRFMQERLKSTMILQVHDELNFNVINEEKEIVERIVLEEMQKAYPMRVPLVADSGWGKNWLEAH
ncbi:MAG: DNA polymerase I [Bacteroidaceae bacterium]|nr:DNA polymerase I [Bacteroidaceae bacterium]